MAENGNRFKVRLVSVADVYDRVVFDVSPTISENRLVDYTQVAPIHMPGSIQVYKGTNARMFTIGAPLISRTPSEALNNMNRLQTLRAWTLPYFGQKVTVVSSAGQGTPQTKQQQTTNSADKADGTTTSDQQNETSKALVNAESGYEMLGAPPMILYLYAYSTAANDTRGTGSVNINQLPVVITSLEISYPNDVDYIPTLVNTDGSVDNTTEPFPVKMEISIGLTETHSPLEYEQFSLTDFKAGKLVNF